MVNINSKIGRALDQDPRKLERAIRKGLGKLVLARVCTLCDGTGRAIMVPHLGAGDIGPGGNLTEAMGTIECPRCGGYGEEVRPLSDLEAIKREEAQERKIQVVKR